MKVVIDIPNDLYEVITNDQYGVHGGRIYDIIRNGTPLPNDKCVEYKNIAIELLIAYLRNAEVVISEYSGNFKKSALELKEKALKFLERLDEGENTFNELVKDMWLSDYYDEESEVAE